MMSSSSTAPKSSVEMALISGLTCFYVMEYMVMAKMATPEPVVT